jgi:tRNA A37 threonylcarbamoyladenosine modification protein TsaB
MIFYIDTTDFSKVTFALSDGKKIIRQSYKIDPHKSHETLAKLGEFLHKSKILNPKSEIKKIVVNKGPGSYTGVRVGVTHALALSFAWGVPIKVVAKEKFRIT